MASITTAGVSSGLDINSIVSQLITAERAPATNRLDTQEAKLQAQLSAIGTFKGALSDFQSALVGVNSATKFQSLTAKASNEALFSASTTSAAQAGSYSIKVTQLAQAQKLVTGEDQRFAAVTDTVGTGTLTFQFGTTVNNTFTENTAKASKTIVIDASNNTLAGLRDAINKANIGVRANIINDGNGYRLSIGVTDTGIANSLKIGVTEGSQTGLSQLLAYDPAGTKNMTEIITAQNALLKVDGLDVISNSNSVVGVVPGVTLNLKSAQASTDTPATLTVAQDSDTTSKAVESFVTAYNKLMETSKSLTYYNAKTGEKGALLGDASVRSIISRVRNLLTGLVPGATGSLHSLTDAGISLQSDGTLKLDSDKLQTALAADPQAVAGLFSRVGRTSDPLVSFSSAANTSAAGTYAINITKLATQATYQGDSIDSPPEVFNIDADSSFAIKVNGKTSAAITVPSGDYTGTELAALLQSRINADSNLQSASASVSVSYETNRFAFTSNTYGSASTVEFTQASTSIQGLGIHTGQQAKGQDVAGTIGQETATGIGHKLTGIGAAAGIAVEILGGATGSRGTVSISDGVAQRLDSLIGDFLGNDGPLSNRTESLNKQVDRLSDERDKLDTRMTALEARYKAQFMAMDKLVGQLTATSNYLTQQFNNSNDN